MDFEGAGPAVDQTIEAAREAGDDLSPAIVTALASSKLRLRDGDTEGALELLLGGEETLTRYATFYAPIAQILAGALQYERGEIESGINRLVAARRSVLDLGMNFFVALASAELAHMYASLRLDEQVTELRSSALEALRAPLGEFLGSSVWAGLGRANLALGEFSGADDDFRSGLEVSSASQYWERPRLLTGRALALIGLFNVVGSYASGVLGGRLSKKYLLAFLYSARSVLILAFLSVPLSAGSALAFSLGGSAASRIQHIGQVESLVFLPLALWMLARALDRSSWPAGAAAGLFASFVVIGRDQVSLIATYVLAGYVLWHWLDGTGRRKRLAASLKPLAAGAIVGACIVTVPVLLTELLAHSSNRPEISFALAGHGSLHPASLLMLAFADVFGASDFGREFWGPPSIPWHELIGETGLYDSQNTGQIYCGALVAVLATFFRYTSIGRALRAVADDHQAAMSVGIPLRVIWTIVWSVAGIVGLAADRLNRMQFLTIRRYLGLVFLALVGLLLVLVVWL